jgi:serine/threonine-protein kinase RsbW
MTSAILQIVADLKHLAQIRHFVHQQAKALGADSDAVFSVIMAVNEMATNIIIHGYGGQPGPIEIEVRPAGDQSLVVYLRDQAPPFDPTVVPDPELNLPLDRRPLGKVGIYLTRRMVDEMTHRLKPEGGNELRLLKKGVL